ncbi:MAG: iron ABC transporter [Flavobacteriales bacterium]|nr:iron ABC transporter [Flavobacteriales bacterium]
MIGLYIIAVASLVAINGAILGSFMMLRRMSMMCDAIVHAVLPGLVIAYLFTATRGSFAMVLGAIASGVLATMVIEWVHAKFRVSADAAIGLTFTTLFSLGIILIAKFAGRVNLDQDCVLFGELAYVPLDLWITESGRNMGPRSLWSVGALTVVVFAFVRVGARQLVSSTFDPDFARHQGVSVRLWHYLLMFMVSLFTIASFNAAGAVMVMGFFILPSATAYLLVRSIRALILLACFVGVLSVCVGFLFAQWNNVSIAGSIIFVNGIVFALAAWFHQARRPTRVLENT